MGRGGIRVVCEILLFFFYFMNLPMRLTPLPYDSKNLISEKVVFEFQTNCLIYVASFVSNLYIMYMRTHLNMSQMFVLLYFGTSSPLHMQLTLTGCSHMMSAKNGERQTPPSLPYQPKSDIGQSPLPPCHKKS